MIAAPIYMLAYTQNDWHRAVALLVLPAILGSLYLGPSFGVIQNSVGVRQRATATTVLLFVVNLIGLGGGPPSSDGSSISSRARILRTRKPSS